MSVHKGRDVTGFVADLEAVPRETARDFTAGPGAVAATLLVEFEALGLAPLDGLKKCPTCDGRGRVLVVHYAFECGDRPVEVPLGFRGEKTCGTCNGAGKVAT